ncbi:type I toxin-antitoxin system ptaRNA1 family toxin [Escherichia coli]|nr:type I toxin-antitoxin system ptaRNA1 family toxin [Escherichia coli]
MTTQHLIEAGQVVHQAANILASLEFIDQAAAQQIGPMAEAVANVFMVVYYQAETGRATPADFQEAMNTLQQVLPRAMREG